MKINLGCGNDYKEGWVNIDANSQIRADRNVDIMYLRTDEYEGVKEVLLSHVIEHLKRNEARMLLHVVSLWLEKNGVITVVVPLVDKGLEWEKQGKLAKGFFQQIVYGERTNEWETHKYAYTEESIKELFAAADLELVSQEDYGWQQKYTLKRKTK